MDHIECRQEPTILRIETKIDSIDEKLDRYNQKTVVNETQIGVIKTGFIVVVGPIIVGLIIYLITNLKGS
jgi:hypothetical protein